MNIGKNKFYVTFGVPSDGTISSGAMLGEFDRLENAARRLARMLVGVSDAARGEIMDILRDTSAGMSSRAARIAAVFRREGVEVSEAFTRAWDTVKKFSELTDEKVGDYLSGLDEIRRYPEDVKLLSDAGSGGSLSDVLPDGSEAVDSLSDLAGVLAALTESVRFDIGDLEGELVDALRRVESAVDGLDLSLDGGVDDSAGAWAAFAALLAGVVASSLIAVTAYVGALSLLMSGAFFGGVFGVLSPLGALAALLSGPLSLGALGAFGLFGQLAGLLSGAFSSGASGAGSQISLLGALLSGDLAGGAAGAGGALGGLASLLSGRLSGGLLGASGNAGTFGTLLSGDLAGGAAGAGGALGVLASLLSGRLTGGLLGASGNAGALGLLLSGDLAGGAVGAGGALGVLASLLSGRLTGGLLGASGNAGSLGLLLSGDLAGGAVGAGGALGGLASLLSGQLTGGLLGASGNAGTLGSRLSVDLAGGATGAASSLGSLSGTAADTRSSLGTLLSYVSGSFSGGWERAWSFVGGAAGYAFETCAATAKSWLNSIIGFINKLTSGAANAASALFDALGALSFTVPEWVPGIGGQTFGFDIPSFTAPVIPYLAGGAVIPPRSPFAAVLGDQPRGVNIESPLSTIETAVENVFARHAWSGGEASYRFVAEINRRTLFDEVITEAKLRRAATGIDPFSLA